MVAPLVRDIVVYSNGDASIAEQIRRAVKGRRVSIETSKIVALERKHPDHSGVIVRLDDGCTRTEAFMVSLR